MQQAQTSHEVGARQPATGTARTAVGTAVETVLNRGLNVRHIRFMALGSAIGTGLFYGSASAIQKAGPAVLFAYMIGGAAVFMVMRALGEMAVRHPVSGSFGQYASRYLGPLAGFVTGWTYVFEMAIVAIADVTAFSIYMGFWFPDVERWIWVLAIIFFLAALNLLSVKVFGELEFWFSLIKVVAIIAMIAGGAAILVFGFQAGGATAAPGLGNLVEHGGLFPNGFEGLLASFAVVMFAFGGIETIGITAGEAADPKKVIPKAVNTVPVRVLLFYVLTLGVLMSLFPWNEIGSNGSPFVQIFSGLGIPAAPHILNAVVITAALSAINSDIFGAGRILFGLARQGHAPAELRQGVAARRAVDDRGDDGRHPAGGRGPERRHPRGRLPADRLDRHLRHGMGVGHDPRLPRGHETRDRPQGPAGVGVPLPVVAGGLRPDHRLHGPGDRGPRRLRGHARGPLRGCGLAGPAGRSPTGSGSRGTDDAGPTLRTKPHRCRWSPKLTVRITSGRRKPPAGI